jgi:hypothetical protein
VKTVTNKRLLISESRDDSNRCTPCRGKPDQHTTHAYHSSPRTPGVRFLWAVPVRDNLSLAPTKLKQAPTPGGSLGNQRKTGPTIVLVASFLLPCDNPRVGERGFGPMVTQLHQLTGLISAACDRYVQYLLAGANQTVLNQHRRGYNLGGAGLPHTHSSTFPTSCLRFPLKVPPDLHFNQGPAINQS